MAKWPDRVQQIVDIMGYGRIWYNAPDEERRAQTRRIAEQCRFELGPNWGHKRADPGRPPSADVFCTQDPFVGWDWSIPEGVAKFPESINLAGQVFIEVEPINHIGTVPQPEPNPTPQPVDLAPVLAAIEALHTDFRESFAAILATVDNIEAMLINGAVKLPPFPEYSGEFRASLFGTSKFSMKPKE